MIQKIHNSLLLQFVCIILAVLMVLSVTLFISYRYVRDTTHSYAEALADSLLKQADNALASYEDNLKYNAETLCRFLTLDARLDEMDEVMEARISSVYTRIALKNREIESAVLLDNDLNAVVTLGRPVDLPKEQRYLRREEDMNADIYYPDEDNYYYGFYYPIYDTVNGDSGQMGMCVFILQPWKIDGTLHNILNGNKAAMLISDSNKLRLSFNTFAGMPPEVDMEELKYDRGYIYREGNWQNGIRISIALPVDGNTSGSNAIRRLVLFAFALIFILLSVIMIFSYYQMARPIHAIDRFIDSSIEHPDRRLNFNRTDEIGTVAAKLDHMLDENQRMIGEIRDGKIRLYETELAQQKMEILAYRNQINPHFLYNTLSCMRDMALINDQDDIAEMAMALSDIFRYAVKASNIVTVRDEVSYINKYARIIDYRFVGKISITTDVEEEVLDLPMIRFFLQPLVENSVFHGLERKMEPGFVNVRIGKDRENNKVDIVVEDDGCGMDEETLEKLRNKAVSPGDEGGIGLSNILQRLRLFYGNEYTFEVSSVVDKGTVIRLSVPDHIIES